MENIKEFFGTSVVNMVNMFVALYNAHENLLHTNQELQSDSDEKEARIKFLEAALAAELEEVEEEKFVLHQFYKNELRDRESQLENLADRYNLLAWEMENLKSEQGLLQIPMQAKKESKEASPGPEVANFELEHPEAPLEQNNEIFNASCDLHDESFEQKISKLEEEFDLISKEKEVEKMLSDDLDFHSLKEDQHVEQNDPVKALKVPAKTTPTTMTRPKLAPSKRRRRVHYTKVLNFGVVQISRK